jgi:hypothetical protein
MGLRASFMFQARRLPLSSERSTSAECAADRRHNEIFMRLIVVWRDGTEVLHPFKLRRSGHKVFCVHFVATKPEVDDESISGAPGSGRCPCAVQLTCTGLRPRHTHHGAVPGHNAKARQIPRVPGMELNRRRQPFQLSLPFFNNLTPQGGPVLVTIL